MCAYGKPDKLYVRCGFLFVFGFFFDFFSYLCIR